MWSIGHEEKSGSFFESLTTSIEDNNDGNNSNSELINTNSNTCSNNTSSSSSSGGIGKSRNGLPYHHHQQHQVLQQHTNKDRIRTGTRFDWLKWPKRLVPIRPSPPLVIVSTMRLKRFHIFLLIGCLIVLWNLITYFVFVSNTADPPLPNEENSLALVQKLQVLEKELTRQKAENEKLLQDVKAIKKKQDGLQKAAGGANPNNNIKPGDVKNPLAASPEEHLPLGPKHGILPILMIACDRPTVSKSLDSLLKYRRDPKKFPIIVSQDCGHAATAEVIQRYIKSSNVTHIRQPDLSNINLPWPQKKFVGYYKIARHYKWALEQVFVTFNFSAVIIVEDDLEYSPDFFQYFEATYPILHRDPLLWCVSAWNDNGKMVSDQADLLYRTDFFPGLGWMIEQSLWKELRHNWPDTFWDDWMRHPEQRKGRQCIRPEISRTSTFGKKGVSKGLFYEKHLKFIKLNTEPVPFTSKDLSYLYKEPYDKMFTNTVYSVPLLTADQAKNNPKGETNAVRVEYATKDAFKKAAKVLGIMDDFKAGVPRAAYRGVVSFMLKGRRVYLAPPSGWKGYDPSWS